MGAQTRISTAVYFDRDDLRFATRVLEATGYKVDTPPVELIARGIILSAHHSANDDGYLLTGAELRLLAHYQTLAVLDPEWIDPRPRYERATHNREQKYVEAALARAIHELRSAAEGGRNNTLNRLVYGLGRLEGLGLRFERVLQEMLEAAVAVGLPHAEAKATLEAAWRKGSEHPADLLPNKPHTPHSKTATERHRDKLRRKFGGKP